MSPHACAMTATAAPRTYLAPSSSSSAMVSLNGRAYPASCKCHQLRELLYGLLGRHRRAALRKLSANDGPGRAERAGSASAGCCPLGGCRGGPRTAAGGARSPADSGSGRCPAPPPSRGRRASPVAPWVQSTCTRPSSAAHAADCGVVLAVTVRARTWRAASRWPPGWPPRCAEARPGAGRG